MSFLFGHKKSGIPKNATFRITQQGSERVSQKFSGDAKSLILLALETEGTLNVEEIAQRAHINRGQAERLIPVLANGGYIALASTTSEAE